jgi:hypothetical protein
MTAKQENLVNFIKSEEMKIIEPHSLRDVLDTT